MQAKKKTAQRSLVVSAVALFLSVAMLIGTTFAWFTDTVTSGTNTIKAGNLDIEVEYSTTGANGSWRDLNGTESLFSGDRWEPGHTEIVYLHVKNAGTLALSYKVLVTPVSENGGVNVDDESFKLSDYLVFGTTTPSTTLTTYTREAARAEVGNATGLADVNALTKANTMVGKDTEGYRDQYMALVVYMPETVGNKANYKTGTEPPTIDLGIKVLATQWTKENDSFGNNYDENAKNDSFYTVGAYYNYYPQVMQSKAVTVDGNHQVEEEISIEAKQSLNSGETETILAKVTVPVGAKLEDNTTSLTVTVVPQAPANTTISRPGLSAEINDPNRETANFDIKVEGIDNQNNTVPIPIEVFVGKGLSNVRVYHNGTLIAGATYDAGTGIVSFTTTSFSDFTAAYDVAAAAIGSKTYGSLQLAVDAAQNSETIQMLRNQDITETGLSISDSKDITLNLNGNSIKTGEQKTNNILISGKLTLTDTVPNSTGKIYTEESYSSAASCGVIAVNGEFVMESGKIEAVIADNTVNNGQFGINIGAGGKVTIKGGEVKAGWYAICNNGNNSGSTIIVNGGTLISTADYAIYNPAKESTVTINGGTVYGASGGISMNRGKLIVSGGTITSDNTGNTGNWSDGTSGQANAAINLNARYDSVTAEIKGGTVTAMPSAPIISVGTQNTVVCTITGGSFSSDPKDYLAEGYNANVENGRYVVSEKMSVWNGTDVTENWNNNYDTTTTFYIDSAADLKAFEKSVNESGKTFIGKTVVLNTGIDLNSQTWTPIGQTGATQFLGTFDGNGHTIKNLTVNNTDEGGNCSSGLFGWLNAATVKNLTVDTARVTGHHNVGVIAGYLEIAGCTIENCQVKNATISCTSANSEANGDKCGGIVGHAGNAGVSVKDCTVSNTTISAGRDAGQVVGAALEANVTGCSATNVTVTANGTSTGANIREEVIGRVL